MRISVSNWSTTEADADATVDAILRAHAADERAGAPMTATRGRPRTTPDRRDPRRAHRARERGARHPGGDTGLRGRGHAGGIGAERDEPPDGGWSTGAPMPGARGETGAAVIDGLIIVPGGLAIPDLSDPCGVSIPSTVAYDPAADAWTEVAPMPGRTRSSGGGGLGPARLCLGRRRVRPPGRLREPLGVRPDGRRMGRARADARHAAGSTRWSRSKGSSTSSAVSSTARPTTPRLGLRHRLGHMAHRPPAAPDGSRPPRRGRRRRTHPRAGWARGHERRDGRDLRPRDRLLERGTRDGHAARWLRGRHAGRRHPRDRRRGVRASTRRSPRTRSWTWPR